MLINPTPADAVRLGILLLNIFQPFPRPLNIFVNVALIFMVLMHGMQLALLKAPCLKMAHR